MLTQMILVCRMQRIPPDQVEAVMRYVILLNRVPQCTNVVLHRTMTGKEYVLHSCQEPNLFVIKKQLRESPDKVTPLSTYYIIDSVIYQAPSLRSVCNSRLVRNVTLVSNGGLGVYHKIAGQERVSLAQCVQRNFRVCGLRSYHKLSVEQRQVR